MYRNAIRQKYPNMTPTYKKIANYILNNYVDVAFVHNVQELGEKIGRELGEDGPDATTIVRFAQRIGYDGWLELRHEIMDSVCHEIKSNRLAGIHNHLDAHQAVLAYDEFASKRIYPGNKEEMRKAAELYAEMVEKAKNALKEN